MAGVKMAKTNNVTLCPRQGLGFYFDGTRLTAPQKQLRFKVMSANVLLLLLVTIVFSRNSAFAASGMFPKLPPATNAFVVAIHEDSGDAWMTSWALQGLVNQKSAEVYLILNPWDWDPLKACGKPYQELPRLNGVDAGLKTLFRKYQDHVKKMFLYDPDKDWTWYLALMSGAQQHGLPVTDSLKERLVREFKWKGEIIDFRDHWPNRIAAYDWALTNLMPQCTKKVVFALNRNMPLNDYAVASKGFVFWLDFKNAAELTEIEKIFSTKGYGVGTSLMGYSNIGDEANELANAYGIGYVVSDFYSNGSFWSSFPDKIYTQAPGRIVPVFPGKIYVSFMWSDGDNIQFDQNPIYHLWKDPARGTVPVGTTLSPSLQELNTPMLDWYYKMMTTNDELMAGPCGVQFIYGRNFNAKLFPSWCDLNRTWVADAGFHTGCLWLTPFMSYHYTWYAKTCGLTGIFLGDNRNIFAGAGVRFDLGVPVVDCSLGGGNEDDIFDRLSEITPDERYPLFRNFTCEAGDFEHGDGQGYLKIKRQVDRLEAAYPGRFVFLLPKDEFATIRAYCGLPPVTPAVAVMPPKSN
jgi:hypothetical protein